jgi:NAD(P)-dependent dehydrogenase (short-subunit alcohol dehydrogenase family)
MLQLTFTRELARRLGSDGGVDILAVHPGNVVTDVVRSLPGVIQWLYKKLNSVLLSREEGE